MDNMDVTFNDVIALTDALRAQGFFVARGACCGTCALDDVTDNATDGQRYLAYNAQGVEHAFGFDPEPGSALFFADEHGVVSRVREMFDEELDGIVYVDLTEEEIALQDAEDKEEREQAIMTQPLHLSYGVNTRDAVEAEDLLAGQAIVAAAEALGLQVKWSNDLSQTIALLPVRAG